MMQREHREAGDELDATTMLTGGCVPPSDGCVTYAVCMAELQQFETDLHRHVHLENHVLFPKAVALEKPPLTRLDRVLRRSQTCNIECSGVAVNVSRQSASVVGISACRKSPKS
jgi:Hemerythrin HHE cation binding domain